MSQNKFVAAELQLLLRKNKLTKKKNKTHHNKKTYQSSVWRTTAACGFQFPKALQLPHIANTSPNKKRTNRRKKKRHDYSNLYGITKCSLHGQTFK